MKRRGHFFKGQVAVLLTLLLVPLLGAMALGADVAVLYFNWVQLQKAADAAVIAGASQLTGQPDASGNTSGNAKAYAAGYACLNAVNDPNAASDAGVSGTQKTLMTTTCPSPITNASYTDRITSLTVDPNNTILSIAVSRQLPYFFGQIVGLTTATVTAAATAKVSGNVGTVTEGLFPLAIQCNVGACSTPPCSCAPFSSTCTASRCSNLPDLCTGSPPICNQVTFNQTLSLGLGSGTFYSPGNYAWLNCSANSNSNCSTVGNLRQAVACGCSTSYSVNSIVTQPGVDVGQIKQGYATRVANYNTFIGNNPQCASDTFSSVCAGTTKPCTGDPLLVVAIANFDGSTGKSSIPIAGFAEFYLNPNTDPSKGNLQGCYLQTVTPESIGSSTAPNLGSVSAPVIIR